MDTWAKYYEQAIAFLNSVKVLSEDAGTKAAVGGEVTWPQGSVCYSNVNTATELFLKACIWVHSGKPPPKTHDLTILMAEYSKAMPQTEFQFQIPLAWLVPSMFNNAIDRTPDQLYRYHIGNDGQPSELTHVYRSDIVINRVNQIERIWQNAWNKLTSSEIQ